MGLLDKKTRIMDVCLTARGRDLLAQNKLRIKHYAFSDDMIDYSGALAQSIRQSASMDDIVYRNHVGSEADSMGSTGVQRDLASFLYSCNEQRSLLPPFVMNVSGSASLDRHYEMVPYNKFVSVDMNEVNDDTYIINTQRDDSTPQDREIQYIAQQDILKLAEDDPIIVTLVKQ